MKKLLFVMMMILVLAFPVGSAQAGREYMLNLPVMPVGETGVTVPTAPGGTSTFVVTPAAGGASGVTVIDRPYERGEKWTLQVDTSSAGISPYTKGQTGSTTYEGVGYQITLYFSNYLDTTQTGGSPYQLPKYYLTGNTPYAHVITVPPVKYMWGRITEINKVSGFWTFPVKLFPAIQGN